MAEFLGTFSAALGVVGVASQAVEVVEKVARFVQNVKDAPEDVGDMASELQTLTPYLIEMELQVRQTTPVPFLSPSPALVQCRRSMDQLSTSLTELDTEISKRRTRGSIRTVWKKSELQKHLERIERAKNTLSLACQSYNSEKLLSRMDRIETALGQSTQLITANHTAVTSLVVSQQQQQLINHSPSAPSQLTLATNSLARSDNTDDDIEEIFVSNTVRRIKPAASKCRKRLRLGLPYWIFSRTLEIVAEQAIQGWNFKIRTYRAVSSDSAIFKACRDADLPLVRQLLASGEASVLDKTPYGWTPLHYLLFSLRTRVSRPAEHLVPVLDLLLESGADLTTINFDYFEIRQYDESLTEPETERLDKAWKTIMVQKDFEVDDKEFTLLLLNLPKSALRTLQDTSWPPWTASPISDRITLVYETCRFSFGLDLLDFSIFGPEPVEDMWAGADDDALDLLIDMSFNAFSRACAYNDETSLDVWHRCFAVAISKGVSAYLWSIRRFVGTYLFTTQYKRVVSERVFCLEMDMAFQRFVRELQLMGQDLDDLGRLHDQTWHEIEYKYRVILRKFWETTSEGRKHVGYMKYLITGVQHGPQPEDWHLWCSNPLDEWARSFWMWAEPSEKVETMPGTWPSEDVYPEENWDWEPVYYPDFWIPN